MLHMPSPMLLGAGPSPIGQQLFADETPPDGVPFTVPEGVNKISAVAIGQGGTGNNTRSGGGGALAYVNDLPVTPGEVLTVIVFVGAAITRAGTNLLRAERGSGVNPGLVTVGTGFPGGTGATNTGNNRSGAGAGGYTSAGQSASTQTALRGGGGSSPYGGGAGGLVGAAPTINGGDYGGGAAKTAEGLAGSTGPGCVRIIWGDGRAFPNTNTGDL